MSRTLIIMRHAKSSWADPTQDDHDRPLNRRGARSAASLGAWLREAGHIPDMALASSSRRTVQTFEGLNLPCPLQVTPRLYHAGPDQILSVIKKAQGQMLLLIAHNPGIAEFAERLLFSSPHHPRFADFPTCATLVVDCDESDWRDVQWGTGRVLDFVTPHDLP